MGTSEEIHAVGRLAGDVVAAGVTTIEQLHRAVAARAFTGVGPLARPVEVVHDAVAGAVYGSVRRAHALAPRAAAAVAAAAVGEGPSRGHGPAAGTVRGAVAGLWGDTLARRYDALTDDMAVRVDGREVPTGRRSLAAAFPAATGDVVVFVHGLCETEHAWRGRTATGRTAADDDPPARPSLDDRLGDDRLGDRLGDDPPGRPSFGDRLGDDLGFTPVLVRYNSGLRVSENGRRLARLLDDLVAAWPTTVRRLVLVGHSMGGLVARSAVHVAEDEPRAAPDPTRPTGGWLSLLTHVVCLGTPHLGAALEKGVNAVSWALGHLPETRGLKTWLDGRSVGVKDLRFGAVVEDDWRDGHPDELLRDRTTTRPAPEHVTYCSLSATVTHDHGHVVGRLVGDLLVRRPSAAAVSRRRVVLDPHVHEHVGGLHHLDLLHHPAVYDHLRRWLTPDPTITPAAERAGVDVRLGTST